MNNNVVYAFTNIKDACVYTKDRVDAMFPMWTPKQREEFLLLMVKQHGRMAEETEKMRRREHDKMTAHFWNVPA